jgi:hypothetical protein
LLRFPEIKDSASSAAFFTAVRWIVKAMFPAHLHCTVAPSEGITYQHIMIETRARERLERWFCCCVGENQGLWDDGQAVSAPVRVGISILFYGKRKSRFPFHCMVGPDWPFIIAVFFLIICINTGVLYVISPIGWIPVVIGVIGTLAVLFAYCRTAFSDPGIVYKNDYPDPNAQRDLESNENPTTLHSPIAASSAMPAVPHTIECGHCDLRRPYTARHCDYCKLCVDNLDHHCPW